MCINLSNDIHMSYIMYIILQDIMLTRLRQNGMIQDRHGYKTIHGKYTYILWCMIVWQSHPLTTTPPYPPPFICIHR